ncbi:MAG: 4Fe-4S binding protein [Rhodospirillales bacterium]
MPETAAKIFVCDCEGTMKIDGEAVARSCRGGAALATNLCRRETDRFVQALGTGPVLVGCTQEAPLFQDLAEEAGFGGRLSFVNLRETGGWSDEAAAATPKLAALIAEAQAILPETPTVPMTSEGVTLIYGRDEVAIEAARQLMDRLDVTVLLTRPGEILPPRTVEFPILRGTIRKAAGHLGAFEVEVDDYAAPAPSSRRGFIWGPGRNAAKSRCDLILDLSGGTPLFPADHKRDGYVRVDPGSPAAVQKAIGRIADLVGAFDRPRYVTYTEGLCAHSRSKRTGCTRCLDVCPTGAIQPAGDHVAIDPYICAGCGSCASVCPTGAASYALPPHDALMARLRTLLTAHRGAGGTRPVLLVHEAEHGDPLIDLLARWGDGLPARVLPFKVNEVTQVGIELLAGAVAYGAAEVRLLTKGRRTDLDGLSRTIDLAEAILSGLGYGSGRGGLLACDDPDDLGRALRAIPPRDGAAAPRSFLPVGDKRTLMRTAVAEVRAAAPAPVDLLALPPGSPFGGLKVDTAACTLCLACVAACPTGALSDDQERPRLSFTEDACVQCGLCANTCPEKAIALDPRLDFTPAAKSPRIVKEEEPFHCVRCAKPFGTKSSIERIKAKLAGRHWMFGPGSRNLAVIEMCADCRAIAQSEQGFDPYAGPPRPPTKTADDYLN